MNGSSLSTNNYCIIVENICMLKKKDIRVGALQTYVFVSAGA
jgi:hypothetical protein